MPNSEIDNQAANPSREAIGTQDLYSRLSILNEIETPVWVLDMNIGSIVWANPAAQKLWLADSEEELYQRKIFDTLSPRARERLEQYRADFKQGKSILEKFVIYPKGQPRHIRCKFSGIELESGRIAMLNQVVGQIADQQPDEQSRGVTALYHTAVNVTLYSTEGTPIYENPAARAARPEDCLSWESRYERSEEFLTTRRVLEQKGEISFVARIHTKAGIRWHEIDLRKCFDPVTGEPAYLSSETDITDRKVAEDRADFLANHDPLTGLPNRTGFAKLADRLLVSGIESDAPAALVFIDFDKFKAVNDSFGHAVGDDLIVEVGKRLQTALRGRDFAGRLSGDEFLLMSCSHVSSQDLYRNVDALLDVLSAPYRVGNLEIKLTVSLGISRFPADGGTYEQLLRRADISMYEAKRLGGNARFAFNHDLNQKTERRLRLENGLKSAARDGDFQLCYQPRICLQSGDIVGAEALLRWKDPTGENVSPEEFVPVLEASGLIKEVGNWVIGEAASQQSRWKKLGHDLRVSVNLSAAQFNNEGFADTVVDTVSRSGASCGRMELEITESMLMGHDPLVTKALQTFADVGMGLSIDDFGTGYSNLAYIDRYPISCLKIDRSFIADKHKRPIVDLIISMCRSLSLSVVAEGVENDEQRRWLAQRECDEFQGFLFSPPVSADEFLALVIEQGSHGRSAPGPVPGLSAQA